MASPKTTVRGRARLARDSQQWMLDYLIQETGKVFHFQGEGRGRLPRSVRSHDMISKHVGLQARRMEALAQAEAAAGHPETALDEVYRMFDQVQAPAELWVFADQHHMPSIGGTESAGAPSAPLHSVMCDWLRDRFADKPLRHPGQVVYVEAHSAGPNSATVSCKRAWYEA